MGALTTATRGTVPLRRAFARLRLARIGTSAGVLLLFVARSASAQIAPVTQLFAQAAKASLDRNFAGKDISYLLLDAKGNVVAERWPVPINSVEESISPGSLVKPFLAAAYGAQYGGVFPKIHCMGTKSLCWLPGGHGTLNLEEAIAQSCNAYFLQLAAQLDRKRAEQTFLRYGLSGPTPGSTSESIVGLGTGWRETPIRLARAYLALERQQQSATPGRIVKGMFVSAARGTARGVDAALGTNAALAKTGTAICSHTPRGAADGFTVVLYPAMQPRLLLLVRVHGVTGAESAKVAGAMLHSLGAGEQ